MISNPLVTHDGAAVVLRARGWLAYAIASGVLFWVPGVLLAAALLGVASGVLHHEAFTAEIASIVWGAGLATLVSVAAAPFGVAYYLRRRIESIRFAEGSMELVPARRAGAAVRISLARVRDVSIRPRSESTTNSANGTRSTSSTRYDDLVLMLDDGGVWTVATARAPSTLRTLPAALAPLLRRGSTELVQPSVEVAEWTSADGQHARWRCEVPAFVFWAVLFVPCFVPIFAIPVFVHMPALGVAIGVLLALVTLLLLLSIVLEPRQVELIIGPSTISMRRLGRFRSSVRSVPRGSDPVAALSLLHNGGTNLWLGSREMMLGMAQFQRKPSVETGLSAFALAIGGVPQSLIPNLNGLSYAAKVRLAQWANDALTQR